MRIYKKRLSPKSFLSLVFLCCFAIPAWSSSVYVDSSLPDGHLLEEAVATTDDGTFHLFSHGRPGYLLIEGQWLDAQGIANWWLNHQPQSWNPQQINLYGCEFAKGAIGRQAVEYLEQTLGIPVAASDNVTGPDGDWKLEVGSLQTFNVVLSHQGLLSFPHNLQRTWSVTHLNYGFLTRGAGDINGDGFPDIATYENTGGLNCLGLSTTTNYYWSNNGNSSFSITPYNFPILNGFDNDNGFLYVDLDNDGDLDIATSYGTGSEFPLTGSTILEGLYNDGTGNFTKITLNTNVIGCGNGSAMLNFADIDGDGDQDLVVADYLCTGLAWYENPTIGPNTTWVDHFLAANNVNSGGPIDDGSIVADFDGDGDPDILIPFSEILFRNNGTGTFVQVNNVIITNGLPSPNVGYFYLKEDILADFDGDGDLDFASPTSLGWFENNGSGSFTGNQFFDASISSSNAILHGVGDFDVDGDVDLLMAIIANTTSGFGFKIYNNDGAGNFTAGQIILDFQGPNAFYSAVSNKSVQDFDGDGDPDFYFGIFGGNCSDTYINNYYVENIAPPSLSATTATASACGVADGSIDLTVTGGTAPYTYQWSNGSTTQDLTNILPGTYSVTVTDAAMATATTTATVGGDTGGGISFSSENVVSTAANGAQSVYAIDVDGDGDMDLLSASSNDDKIAWYENDGSQNFTERVISTNANGANSVYAIDVDGDGDVDVISTSFLDDKIAWYENDGSQNFTERVISTNADDARSVYAIDVDGDGDVDVLSACGDGKVAWYENDGSQNFTERVISNVFFEANSVFAIDMDGDGDVDVLSAHADANTIAWYENDGNQNFTQRLIPPIVGAPQSVYAIDVDGDGDVDVLSAIFLEDKIAWYENDGSQNFTQRVISTNADGVYSVYAIDVDGDGDLDVLSASLVDGKIAWYENDGSQNFTERVISTTANGAISVYATDVDGDGDVDVLSASLNDDKIAWYENVTDCPSSPPSLSATTTAASACGVADGSIDLTVTGGTAPYTYQWSNGSTTQDLTNILAGTYSVTVTDAAMNTATTTATVGGDTGVGISFSTAIPISTLGTLIDPYATAIYAIDLDGDGDTDLLGTSSFNGRTSWYENDGGQNFTEHLISTTTEGTDIYAIDVDGDGDIDLLTAVPIGDEIAWYENDGNQNFTKRVISTNAFGAGSVYAIDVDGDGDVDVLSSSFGDDKIAWYENDGSQNFTERVISTNADQARAVYAIDVDGDGDVDVLSASNNDDKIAWYENDGSQNFTERVISTTANAAGSVYAIDVDGDGDMDVLSSSLLDDKIAWYENDGSQNFTERVISTNADGAAQVYAIDVDGDGDVDVLSASIGDDKIAWYENDGSQNFTERVIATNNTNGADRVYAIDVDGDGDVDVLTNSGFDGNIGWFENQTICTVLAAQIQAQTNVDCFGQNTGAVTVTALGGLAPYQYALDGGSFGSSPTFSGLAAGSYTITVQDATMATVAVPVVITQPTAGLLIDPAITQPTCFDFGSISLSVTGGTMPYTYNWADVAGNNNPRDRSGLTAGDYSVTVTDANGCILSSGTLTLNAPTDCGPVTVCTGDPITTFSVTPDPNNISYQWTVTPAGAVIVSGQGTPEIVVDWSGATIGAYEVCVVAINDCGTSDPVCQDVNVFASPAAMATTGPACEGDVLQLFATGGTQYAWSGPNGFTSSSANPVIQNATAALNNGTYMVTVTNDAGCEATASVVVSISPPPVISLVETASACGLGNGAVDLTITSGTPGYSIQWSNGSTMEDLSNLAAGAYFVTVTDANGCTASEGITISDTPGPNLSIVKQEVSCPGGMDGSASLTINNGTAPFMVLWNTGATSNMIAGLAAGNYSVTVTDANGCSSSAMAMITEPDPINLDFTKVDVDCFGEATGSINLLVSGGTPGVSPAYTYSWTGPGGFTASSEDISMLVAGTYNVTVTDGNACPETLSITIGQPAAALDATPTVTDVTCFGDSDGQIVLSVTGGTGPFMYSWTGPGGFTANTKDIAGLVAGTYNLTVTDAKGCTFSPAGGVEVSQPNPIDIFSQYEPLDVSCNGASDGLIEVTQVTGGTGPYTYLWSNGATTEDLSGLAAGNYTLTVTDANGCTGVQSYMVTEPSPLVVVPTVTDVDCFGNTTGSVTLNISGGAANPPFGPTSTFTYAWSNGATTRDLNGVSAGTYTVTITETYDRRRLSGIGGLPVIIETTNCAEILVVTINQPAPINVNGALLDVQCNGESTGVISLNVNGGTAPFMYSWTGPGGFTATTSDVTDLAAGSYAVTITDANLCQRVETYTIFEPTPINLTTVATAPLCNGEATGSIDLTVSGGGFSPVSYNWSNGDRTEDLTMLPAGTYSVTVTYLLGGCTASATQVVTEPDPIQVSVSQSNIDCFGAATGSIDLTVTGGTGTYSYNWTGPNGFGSGMQNISSLAAGNYMVTVSDASSCEAVTEVIILQNAPIAISGDVTNVNCFGEATGGISLMVSGGSGAYTYNWSDGSNVGPTRTGLAAGAYDVTVEDALGCMSMASFLIEQPAVLSLMGVETAPNCNGESTGAINLTVTGGTPNYTYTWSDGPVTDEDRTGLAAGTYIVTVMDANGCMDNLSFMLDDPAEFTVSLSLVQDVTCLGGDDGSATATTTNGTALFDFIWSNGATAQTPTNFTAGDYSVTVTDANGCVAQAGPITIGEPLTAINLSASATPSYFCGVGTGTIDLTVTDGVGPYTYAWSGLGVISGEEDQSGLSPGIYTVVVTDNIGCTAMLEIEVPSTLVLGDPICEISGTTYSVIFSETSGAIITVGPGNYTITGNVISGIPLGTNLLVTATNPNDPNCFITLTATSPVTCNICDNLISIAGSVCAPDFNSYAVNFILAPGTVLTTMPMVGTIGANAITGIPAGTNITLIVTNPACGTTMETIPITAPDCCPDDPVASIGQVVCVNGSTYTYTFTASPGATVVSTNGTISSNTVTVAVGTNDILTVFNKLDCGAVTLSVASPANCNVACEQPDLTIGNSVCVDGDTYSVTFTETTGAIITTAPDIYTITGNVISGIEVGEDVEVIATNPNDPACTVSLTATSPDDCLEPCPDELISVSALGVCAPNLTTYTVNFTLAPGATLTTDPMVGTIGVNSITGIPAGTNIRLIATSLLCNKVDDIVVVAPDCSCPNIDPPVSGGNAAYCVGEPIPSISATVPAGQTVDWYDAPTAGNLLASGMTSFMPTSAGTYYAEARETVSSCVSATRTAIIVTETTGLDAGTNGVLTICAGTTVTEAQLFAALGGTPDPSGVWTPALAGAGTYTYTHAAVGACPETSAIVTVTEEVCSTVAINDINQTPINVPVSGNVQTNDYDPQGDAQTVTSALADTDGDGMIDDNMPLGVATTVYGTNSMNIVVVAGTVLLNANGTYTYTPATNFIGDVPFAYMIIDDNPLGASTDDATVNINVIPAAVPNVNEPPVANDDTNITEVNVDVSGNVMDNDSDPDGDPITVTSALADTDGDGLLDDVLPLGTPTTVYGPNSQGVTVIAGTITLNPNGTYTYDPAPTFVGEVQLDYTISDPEPLTDNAILTITITENFGNATYANDDANVSPQGVAQTGNVLDNDTDPEGDDQVVTGATASNGNPIVVGVATTLPSGGTLTLNANGTYTYTPAPGFVGTEVVVYAITDDGSPVATDEATLYLTTLPLNNTYAQNDINQTPINIPVSGDVLTNDYDPQGDAQTVTSALADTDGDGMIDDNLPLGVATTVYGTNSMNVVVVAGTVLLNANGTYTYTPATNFIGDVPFAYMIIDDNPLGASTDDATVNINVIPAAVPNVNEPPVANDDTNITEVNVDVSGNVLDNDSDPDGDPITVTSVLADTDGDGLLDDVLPLGTPTTVYGPNSQGVTVIAGTITLNPNGTYTYDPAPTFVGEVQLDYTISDPEPLTDNAILTITITENFGNATYANDDANVSPQGVAQMGNVLDNDTDPEGDDQVVTGATASNGNPIVVGVATTLPSGGTLTLNVNGTYTYTPAPGFVGTEVVVYAITDDGSPVTTDVATLYLTTLPQEFVKLNLSVLLQGALLNTVDGLMRDDLRSRSFLPTTEPYSSIGGFVHLGGGGTELIANPTTVLADHGNNSIVDWVFVELRSSADPTQVVATRAGLLQRDGNVVDVDGVSSLCFTQSQPGDYYVAVRHRNHIGTMTANAITLTANGTVVDFRDTNLDLWNNQANYNGIEQITINGQYALWAGNTTSDDRIIFAGQSNDKDPVFNEVDNATGNVFKIQTYIYPGYHFGDVNLDGDSIFAGQKNDVDPIFNNVDGHPANIFKIQTFIILEQLAQ